MKVWTKVLSERDLHECCAQVNDEFPGCDVFLGGTSSWSGSGETLRLHDGPRSRRFDHVHLRSHTGTFHANTGTHGAAREMAASWTEWGWFLARVFERDPEARCGDYRGVDDFHKQTQGRFIDPRTPRERQIRSLHAVA